MKLVERKDIDTQKWNERVAQSAHENVFCYTWYLDAVAKNWCALISDDYNTILPLPYVIKLGVKQFYQAPFTREYSIFGNDFNWPQALDILHNQFALLDFRADEKELIANPTERKHQLLTLDETTEENYRSNAKRLIKKGHKHYTFEALNEPGLLIQLFKDTVAHKIESIGPDDLICLNQLMQNAIDTNHGEMLVAKDENNTVVAGGFFLKDKKRITYLKGASQDDAKKQGAMYALFDTAFKRYRNEFNTFDFGGSDVENVATFYKKFGATDRNYYHYTLDQTPFWFKTLKKLRK